MQCQGGEMRWPALRKNAQKCAKMRKNALKNAQKMRYFEKTTIFDLAEFRDLWWQKNQIWTKLTGKEAIAQTYGQNGQKSMKTSWEITNWLEESMKIWKKKYTKS